MSRIDRPPSQSNPPAARDRGDIQQGHTGDKVKGFDPAMAPMETDAEAGGVSQPVAPELRSMRPTGGKPKQTNSSSYGSAMRPFDGEEKARSLRLPLAVATLVLVAVLVAAVILIS